jgi:hypothetical protein
MSTLAMSDDQALTRLPEILQDGFEDLGRALCIQRRSAVVTCAHAEELETVSRVLSRQLRQISGLRLEMLQASSSELLLQRFNEVVASLPLEQARHDSGPQDGLTLWVVRLSNRLDWQEVNLLLSMVQGFPGTGVRLLLLCARDSVADQAKALGSRWGSSLYLWDISTAQRPPSESKEARPLAVGSAVKPIPSGLAVESRATHIRGRLGGVFRGAGFGQIARLASGPWQWVAARLKQRISAWLMAGVARCVKRLLSLQPCWRWGLGGLLMSLGATAAAWWQARPDADFSQRHPLRRPVPEIVELLDDTRSPSIRQEQPS